MDSIYEKIWNMDMEKNPYLSYLPNSANNVQIHFIYKVLSLSIFNRKTICEFLSYVNYNQI